jgi:hypothetical protein
MSSRKDDAAWIAKNFPTASARKAADEAVDSLDPHEPMTSFLDTWIAAYIRAGGKTKLKL